MKITNFSFLVLGVVFYDFAINCLNTTGKNKIKFNIEVVNKDELLSPSHLTVKKNIMHNGKNISIKMFEKISEHILERAFIVEEVDNTDSLSKSEKKELLSLKKSKKDSEEDDTTDDDITEDDTTDENTTDDDTTDDNTTDDDSTDNDSTDNDNTDIEEDGKMKVISTEKSKENDVDMIRKIYKQTIGNKQITYCYMTYSFNLDLEKLNQASRSELFKSLDSMPDYLSFLSPNEEITDTEKLLEEEYDQLHDIPNKKTNLSAMSVAELSHNSEKMDVNISKYITTLDDIINYILSKSKNSKKHPACYDEMLSEREYLYKLSSKRTSNENIINEEYWKNKSKIDKYFLYEALTHLKNIYFSVIKKETTNGEIMDDDENSNDISLKHDKFIDLINKILECHALLDTTEILDFVILQNIENVYDFSKNENKTDKELIQQCINLFKVVLNNKGNLFENDTMNIKIKHSENNINNLNENKTKESIILNHRTFNKLQEIAREKYPTQKYMLRKETPENKEFIVSLEADEPEEENYDSDEMNSELDNNDTDETDEIDEIDESDETDESDENDDEPEIEYKLKQVNFLEYNNKISNDTIATEIVNEDSDIPNETVGEHKADMLEVLNLEKQKMLNNDMEKSTDDNEKLGNDYNEEITSDTDQMKDQHIHNGPIEPTNETSHDSIATEMFNEDPSIADETESEHKDDISQVVILEERKILKNNMNNNVDRYINSHNKKTSSYLENASMIQDDDDDEDIFSSDDDTSDNNDIFSDNDGEIDFDDSNVNDDDDEEEDINYDGDDNDDDDEEEEDTDNDDDEEEDNDDDDEDENMFDNDDNDDNDDNENFSDKIKKQAKKGFKKLLNKGKDMAKDGLSKLLDEAGNQVHKLTTKATDKIKNKLNSSDNKNKSKKNKKTSNKKIVKKAGTKKIVKKDGAKKIVKKEVPKKIVKKEVPKKIVNKKNNNKKIVKEEDNKKVSKNNILKGEKNTKSKKDNLTTSDKKTKKGKGPKSVSNLEIETMNDELNNLSMESSFINLTDASTKSPINKKIRKTVVKINSEMSNLEKKRKNLLKQLEEPTDSDEKIINSFEKYYKKEQKKKNKD